VLSTTRLDGPACQALLENTSRVLPPASYRKANETSALLIGHKKEQLSIRCEQRMMADEKNLKKEDMEIVAFTLIGKGKERFVPEVTEFRPCDWQALRHSYNARENSAIRSSDGKKSLVSQAS
jgi:hypothetical protein